MITEDKLDLLVPPGKGLYEKHRLKWRKYFFANPGIWDLFDSYARAAFGRREHYSPWIIINRIRWHHEIDVASEDEFKISNNHIQFYSRLWMAVEPHFRGRFFSLRPCEGEDFEDTKRRLMRS